MRRLPRWFRVTLIAVPSLAVSLTLPGWLLLSNGIWIPGEPGSMEVEHYGIDVSHHQGHIEWPKVAMSGQSFAYIKATEGDSWIDPRFAVNSVEVGTTNLKWGPYHYFSFNVSGKSQAAHFANVVKESGYTLAPAIDVEFDPVSNFHGIAESARDELEVMVAECMRLGLPEPLIYVTPEVYEFMLKGRFTGDYWVRNLWDRPRLEVGDQVYLWQYTDRSRLDGIQGFVDLNGTTWGALEILTVGDWSAKRHAPKKERSSLRNRMIQ